MFDKIVAYALKSFYGQFMRNKIREGSIKAVKGYVQMVKLGRLALLGLFGLGALAALLVAGVVLTVVGIIGLLPVAAATMAISVLIVGLLFVAVAAVAMGLLFSQKRWLEQSRSHELIDAVTSPWEGTLPPNPINVIRSSREANERSEVHLQAAHPRNPELSAYGVGP